MVHITPGSLSRIINPIQFYCKCVRTQQRNFIAGQNNVANISTNMKISILINTSLGGKIVFGNSYLGQPPRIDALGSIEGQAGGSFSPIRTNF